MRCGKPMSSDWHSSPKGHPGAHSVLRGGTHFIQYTMDGLAFRRLRVSIKSPQQQDGTHAVDVEATETIL